MSSFFSRFAGLSRILTVVVVIALVIGVVFVFTGDDTKRTVRVDFTSVNSLYEGSDVRILGVAVGTVDKLTAKGDRVEATISYPGDVRLPTDVKAVVISPAIVGDRFVQLAPGYSGGAVLPDGAKLGVDRSAVPVELDEVYKSLDDLALALGPEGANKNGALSSLIEDTATQLDGQGQQLNTTLQNFGQLSQTLSNNKDDLFGSVREVNQFVELLQRNDGSVRQFFDSTARVSTVLEGERDDLAKTLEALSRALIDVRRLVKDNRGELRSNVENLQVVADVLASRDDEIEEILIDGPTALSNVTLTYNGDGGTLDNRSDILDILKAALPDLASVGPALVCNLLGEVIPPGEAVCDGLAGLIDGLFPNSEGAGAENALSGLLGSESAPDAGLESPAQPSAGSQEIPSLDKVQDTLAEMLGGKP